MTDQLELMVKYLIHLQFYSEEDDVLYSRDKHIQISIPGIGPVIAEFVSEFSRHLDYIRNKEYREFLELVAVRLPIDVDLIEHEFVMSLSQLSEAEITDELIANFLIGPIRSALQKEAFDSCISEICLCVMTDNPHTISDQIIHERLSSLYMGNDPTVSLLYNLTLLQLLVSTYGQNDLIDRVDKLVEDHREKLATKLCEAK